MGLSKSTRIQILLAIDTVFFLLELSVGYWVHSLALVADAFHMLNDVISLCVGLWAVKVATSKTKSNTYTYGWQRAETLGALVNGVFLVALCMSIFLEAIQRFVEPQEVSQPKLVLVVGCCGLASNILGLLLFHDHSHGPGGHSHGDGHDHGDTLGAAEEGHAHLEDDTETQALADPHGNIEDILPQSLVWKQDGVRRNSEQIERSSVGTSAYKIASSPSQNRTSQHHRSRSRGYSSLEEIRVHPASFRNEIIAAGRLENIDSGTESDGEQAIIDVPAREDSPLLGDHAKSTSNGTHRQLSESNLHTDHRHAQPPSHAKGSHGHSHDLNMRGVFLHVVGDALGNVGVIASALIIWLTTSPYRFYSDPAISLVITVIILCSAIPLCKAASRILLQAVPMGLSVEDIKADITSLPGVRSCHHLHVWQLSDTKLVASLHVQVEYPMEVGDLAGEGSAKYMALARSIRRCLHAYGIHSSTIQPEFCLEADLARENGAPYHDHAHESGEDSCEEGGGHGSGDTQAGSAKGKGSRVPSKVPSRSSLLAPDACLLDCGDECGNGKQCCAPDREELER